MNKSLYLMLLTLCSASLFSMEIGNEGYAERALFNATDSVKVLLETAPGGQEKQQAWFDLLINLGKVQACKEMNLFNDETAITDIVKGKQEINDSFLLFLKGEKKSFVLDGLVKLGQDGLFGKENIETFKQLSQNKK